MLKFKDTAEGASKKENVAKCCKMVEALREPIPQIVDLQLGVQMSKADGAFDVVLLSTFRNEGDLDVYQNHPEHEKVKTFLGKVVSERSSTSRYKTGWRRPWCM
jgi:hypothetical protein